MDYYFLQELKVLKKQNTYNRGLFKEFLKEPHQTKISEGIYFF